MPKRRVRPGVPGPAKPQRTSCFVAVRVLTGLILVVYVVAMFALYLPHPYQEAVSASVVHLRRGGVGGVEVGGDDDSLLQNDGALLLSSSTAVANTHADERPTDGAVRGGNLDGAVDTDTMSGSTTETASDAANHAADSNSHSDVASALASDSNSNSDSDSAASLRDVELALRKQGPRYNLPAGKGPEFTYAEEDELLLPPTTPEFRSWTSPRGLFMSLCDKSEPYSVPEWCLARLCDRRLDRLPTLV